MGSMLRAGALALGLLSCVQGCVESNDVAPAKTSAVRFAVAGDASLAGVRVGQVRTVAQQVNVAEPLFVGFDDGRALVTYASAHHAREDARSAGIDGVGLALDPDTLQPLATTPRAYPPRAKGQPPANLSSAHASVTLKDGRTMNVWTDEATGHVLADVDGSTPQTIWSGDAIGAPHAATADGQHVVVAFATGTENGFDLVAMSLEAR